MKSFTFACVLALTLAVSWSQSSTTEESIYGKVRSTTEGYASRSTTPEEDIYGKRTTPEITSTTEGGIYGVRTSTPVYPERTTTEVYPERTTTKVYPEKTTTKVYPERTTTKVYPEKTTTEIYPEKTTTKVYGEKTTTPVYGQKTTTEVYPEKTTTEVYPEKTTTKVYGEKTTTPVYGEKTTTEVYPEKTTTKVYPEKTTTKVYGEKTTTPVYGEKTTTEVYPEKTTTKVYPEKTTTPAYKSKTTPRSHTTIPPYSKVTPFYIRDVTCSGKKLVIRCHEKNIQNLVKLSLVENFNGFKNNTPEDALKFVRDIPGILDVLHDELHWTAPSHYDYPILQRTRINTEICPSPVIKYLRFEVVNEEYVKLRVGNEWFEYKNPSPTSPFTVIFPQEKRVDHFDIFVDKIEGSKKGGIGKIEIVACCERN